MNPTQILLPGTTYKDLMESVGRQAVNDFVHQAVQEKLFAFKRDAEQLYRQKLIADYQHMAQDQNLTNLIEEYGAMSWADILSSQIG